MADSHAWTGAKDSAELNHEVALAQHMRWTDAGSRLELLQRTGGVALGCRNDVQVNV
jgi:hypothetical protein